MLSFEVGLTKLLVRFVGLLPFWALWPIADFLKFLLFNVFGYRRKVVENNLRKSFPAKNERERKAIARLFYHHFSDMLVESIKGLSLPKVELLRRFSYRNPGVFQPFFEKKQSIILLGSHYGNWEWGVLSFPLAVQHKVTGVYKPLKNKRLDYFLSSLRKKWGLHLTDMAQAGRAIVQQKNEPTIFVLIGDQTPFDMRSAHWTTFLSQDTPWLNGMDKLARKTCYPVFYFEIVKLRRGFYEVTFSPICEAPNTLAEGEVTALFSKKLEETIRRAPAYWLWSHRRWKRAQR